MRRAIIFVLFLCPMAGWAQEAEEPKKPWCERYPDDFVCVGAEKYNCSKPEDGGITQCLCGAVVGFPNFKKFFDLKGQLPGEIVEGMVVGGDLAIYHACDAARIYEWLEAAAASTPPPGEGGGGTSETLSDDSGELVNVAKLTADIRALEAAAKTFKADEAEVERIRKLIRKKREQIGGLLGVKPTAQLPDLEEPPEDAESDGKGFFCFRGWGEGLVCTGLGVVGVVTGLLAAGVIGAEAAALPTASMVP